jgi:integrase
VAWLAKIKRSKNWYVFFYEGAQRVGRSCGTTDRRIAERILEQVERDILLGKFHVAQTPAGTRMLAEAMTQYESYLREAVTPKTGRMYRNSLRQLASWLGPGKLGALALSELTPELLDDFYRARSRGGSSDTTVKMDSAHIKAFCAFCLRREWITVNPAKSLWKVKHEALRVRILDDAEIDAVLHHEGRADLRELYRFLLLTGARVGESCALRWADIDNHESLIYFRPSTTKRGRRKEIDPGHAVQELIGEMKARRGRCPREEKIWKFKGEWASRKFGRALERAGLTDRRFTIHCLRHTAASRWLMAGVPLRDVSAILRHSSTDVTERHYGHFVRGHLSAQMDRTPLARLGKEAGNDGQETAKC